MSILEFFHLYLYDLYLVIFKRDYHFLRVWFGWKKAAEIFYSILTYNSLKKISKVSSQCEFISWHENQITNRSFSLGVSSTIKDNLSDCNLSTFNGSLFTQNTKKQFLPLKSELEIGFWGQKYYLQDYGSLKEMKSFLKNKNLKIHLKVVSESMLRTKTYAPNENIKSKSPEQLQYLLTLHIGISLVAFYQYLIKKISFIIPKKSSKKRKNIYIRLHPALNKEDAIKEINAIKEIPSFIKYKFIENHKESLLNSIKLTTYCFLKLFIRKPCNRYRIKVFSVDSIIFMNPQSNQN